MIVRDTLGRMRNFLARIVPVVLLTCLIWIYADQRTTDTAIETVHLTLDVPKGSKLIPTLAGPNGNGKEVDLQITLSGQRSRLEAFRKELAAVKFELTYLVELDNPKATEIVRNSHKIIEQLLASNPRFQAVSAVSVDEVSPPELRIKLDRWISPLVAVKVLSGTITTGTIEVFPKQAKVTLEKSVFDRLDPEERRVILVDLENHLRNRPEDTVIDDEFSIPQILAGHAVTTDPTHVKVRLKILQQYETKPFKFLRSQVMGMGPLDLFEEYRVQIEEPNSNITVALRGPVSVMQGLRQEDITPFIRLDHEDTVHEEAFFSREVQFILPDKRIKIDTDEIPRPRIGFKLVKISAGGN